MTVAHRRHDMIDEVWERLRPHLPGGEGKRGRPAQDNRRFIDAVCWILRTGAPWRDLPPDYGDWKNTHRRFCRWRDRGVWAGLLEAVIDDPDFEWLRFIDAVCWILRTGAPWRDLPPDYGDWKNTHRRFCRWRDRGVWAGLLEAVIDDPDFEWLMIDASYIKAHPHSAGARGGNQSIARTKGG